MLEESIVDLFMAVYMSLIAIIFGFMYKKREIKFLWFLGTILNVFASLFFYLRHFNAIYRIIGNIFYFLAAISFGVSVFQEYHQLIMNEKKIQVKNHLISKYLAISIPFSLILINLIQVTFFMFSLILGVMLLKIYLKKKSITHLFMILAFISGGLTLIFSILSNIEVNPYWEIANFMKIIYYSSLLATGLSAPIEERLNKSEERFRKAYSRAEFYKDLFAHDISNILQSIQSSMDLLNIYMEKPKELKELTSLVHIAKNQVLKGAKLISNVRMLSEIEQLEFVLKPVEFFPLLNESIEILKLNNKQNKINVELESFYKKYLVSANQLLINVFENILVNAIKYNNNEIIEILIRISDVNIDNIDYIKIEFIDNGIGVPDYIKGSIFQRAFIKEKSVSGMGLGLSLVHTIIKKYNGQIWVEDKIKGDYSKGSNFIIIIPEVK